MKRFNRFISFLMIFSALLFFSCKVVKDQSNQKSLPDLCLSSGTISGWNSSGSAGCTVQGKDQLRNLIDGGDVVYLERGLFQYINQDLTGSAGKTVSILIMDFETADKAKVMYDYALENKVSDELPITGYDRSVAAMNAITGGRTFSVYAWFDRFYFELVFSEMEGSTDGNNNAGQFLSTYQTKLR